MKKAFTLLELIVVIIILGVLATLGFTQYTKMVEQGRTAEAKMILGQIRTAEIAAYMENGYALGLERLPIDAPVACRNTHYFWYDVKPYPGDSGTVFAATAIRCSADGKEPQGPASAYEITIVVLVRDLQTIWSGTPGYY